MRHWNDIEGTVFFNKLFTHYIEIGEIYIHSLTVEYDQPSISIGFDIPEFPDRLPPKWEGKGYNTCRIGLTCNEISNLQIANLPRREIFFAEIKHEDEHFIFNAKSKNASIEFRAKWLSMDGPSVYVNCPEPGDHTWSK